MPLESTLSLSAPAGDTQPLACAYWLADTARSRFLFVSAGFEALWGRPVSALHEDPSRYLAAVHPDDLPLFADQQPPVSGRRQRLFRLRQPDGSYRAVAECTFSMISPFGGEPRLAGVLFEQPADPALLPEDWLAGRENIVDELAGLYQRSISNDDNLRHLFAYSAIAVIVLDAEGYVCEWNHEAERLLGWPDSAALGRPLAALLVPAPLQNRFHDWLFADDGGAMAHTMRPLEIPALHSNGSRVPLELSGWQFVLSGLPYRGITLRDMTRQHVAEQVLYEHMERARMLFEFASIAMVVLDHTGVIIDWNIHAEQIFGLHGEHAVGRPLLEVLPLSPDQLPAGLLLGDQGMQLAEATSLEFTLQRDGQLQHVDASFWPFSSSQQGFIGAFFRDISARRRSEDALRQSEEHYRLVIDNVRDGIVVVQGMRIVLSNPRAAEISGYSIAELAEVDFASLIHPDDQGRVLDMHRRRVGGEQVEARDDLRVVNKNGEVRWVDSGVVLIEWHGRQAALVFFTDITHRKRLEKDLTSTLRERESILDNTIAGMAFVDGQGFVRWVNSTAAELFQTTPERMQGGSLERYYDVQQDFLRTTRDARQAFAEGRAYATEMRMRTACGQLLWVQLSGKPINPEQVAQGTVWVMMDISRRKELEFELLRTHTEREAILQSALVGMAFVTNRRLLWINRTFSLLLGYSEAELIGKSSRIYFRSDEEFDSFGRDAYGCLAGGQIFTTERQLQTKSGKLIWVQMNGTSIVKSQPDKGTIWTLVDVSERHAAEQEIRDALAKQQELNVLKSRFVSMTSHEFRTPLATVLSSAELLRHYHDRLPPERREALLESIQTSVQRMTDMLDNILLIGRVEAERVEFVPQPLDVARFCQSLVQEVSHASHARGEEVLASVVMEMALPQPVLPLDEKLLREILGNLLSNAFKYSPQGGEIRFSAYCDGNEIVFDVQDQGIGIPPEDLPQLFDAFHRAQNVGPIPGTGLGLCIVRKSVELHHGQITVSSEQGRGTQFCVRLPVQEQQKGRPA